MKEKIKPGIRKSRNTKTQESNAGKNKTRNPKIQETKKIKKGQIRERRKLPLFVLGGGLWGGGS